MFRPIHSRTRAAMDTLKLYQFGGFQLRPAQHSLLRDGQPVPLRPKVFDTLVFLVQHRGYVVSKDWLIKSLWPETYVDRNNLYGNICALRKALGSDHKYVETIPKIGFRFVAEVTESEEIVPDAVGKALRGGGRASLKSLAVVSFTSRGSDPFDDYLSDAISDGLINFVSTLPNWRVISRASLSRYGGKVVDPRTAGRDLNVFALLTVGVTRHAEEVTVSLELADATDGSRMWGDRYARKVAEMHTLEEEILRGAMEKLRPKLASEQGRLLNNRHTQNAEAYQLYLKGLYLWNKRTARSVKQAIVSFERAIDRDGGYALAYAEMAHCYTWLGLNSPCPLEEWRTTAVALAKRAVTLDYQLGEGHAALAYARLGNWNWLEIENEFERAIELSSNNSEIHGRYATYLATIGKFEKAMQEILLAQELDPLSVNLQISAAKHLYMAGLFDRAIEHLQQTIEMEGNYPLAHLCIADVYAQQRKYDQAITEYETTARMLGLNVQGNFLESLEFLDRLDANALMAKIAYVHGCSAKKSEAKKMLTHLQQLPERLHFSPLPIAQIYIGLRDHDNAFVWLEKAHAVHAGPLIWIGVDPLYAPLRDDPRFSRLLQGIGLTRVCVAAGIESTCTDADH